MRFWSALYGTIFIAVLCMNGAGAVAADALSASPAASAPKDAPAPQGETPQQAAARIATEKNPPLLPVRPKDFNVLTAPTPVSEPQMMDAQQQFEEVTGMYSVYMTQLSGYLALLAKFSRWQVLALLGGVALFFVQLLYLRNSVIHMGKSVDAARLNADIARKSLEIMKETSEREIRAYVFTNGAKGEMMADKSGRFIVRVEVRNFGATPAYGVTGWMNVFADEIVKEKELSFVPPDMKVVETVLPPRGVCFFYAHTIDPISPDKAEIGAGRKAIYCQGEVRYRDVFGVEHYARFRIKCTGEQNLASGSFDHCFEGNEAN